MRAPPPASRSFGSLLAFSSQTNATFFPGLDDSAISPWGLTVMLTETEELRLRLYRTTSRHGLGLLNTTWTKHKISGTMSFWRTRPKCRCLSILHSTTSGQIQMHHVSTNTSYQLLSMVVDFWWFELVLQFLFCRKESSCCNGPVKSRHQCNWNYFRLLVLKPLNHVVYLAFHSSVLFKFVT